MRRGLIKPREKSRSSSIESPPNNKDESPPILKPPAKRRTSLPHEQFFGSGVSVMAILTKSLPISTFEPLSDIQACVEEFRYVKQFLDKMPSVEDPVERMSLLCGFIVSGYSGMIGRRRKPFNPLLGETYDYISEDGWRYHGEKVSQDPSITACHVEGKGWEFFQALQERTSFSINSVSITSDLPVRLKFANGDDYAWTKVTTTVKNARGEAQHRRVVNEGAMNINSTIGVHAILTFHGNEENTIAGEIVRTQDATVSCRLIGSWDKGLNKVLPNRQVSKIFEPIPPSKHAEKYYGFSDFAMGLNEIRDHEKPYLPATDSRLRPDQRYLEHGETKLAEHATKKLEQAQRKRINQDHKPLWFHKEHDEFTGEVLWQSNKKYWKSKEAQFCDEHSRQMIQLFETKS